MVQENQRSLSCKNEDGDKEKNLLQIILKDPWQVLYTQNFWLEQKGRENWMTDQQKKTAEQAADTAKENTMQPEKPRYLLASDFDNTLYWHDGRGFLDSDLEAIERMRRHGGLFGLNTGRPAFGIREWLHSSQEIQKYDQFAFDFTAGSSGAEILDKNRKFLLRRSIDWPAVVQAENLFRDYLVYCAVDGFYYRQQDRQLDFYLPGNTYRTLAEFEGQDIPTMALLFPPDEQGKKDLEHCLEQLREYRLPIDGFANQNSIDLVPAGCSKAQALMFLAAHFGIGMDHVYAIGDGINDIPALQLAARGFAIASGEKEVKEAADYVVENVGEALDIIEKLETR